MLLTESLLGSSSTAATYIEDVFSTYLYTGNSTSGGTQTITNGVDLSTKGGMVWIKGRSAASNNVLFDTTRGAGTTASNNQAISSNLTTAEDLAASYDFLSAFNTDGFTVKQGGTTTATRGTNYNAVTYASWTFRKQAKFFDVVTWTGDGTNDRVISHNLGSVPGCIIQKPTSTTGAWYTYHRSLTPPSGGLCTVLFLNTTDNAQLASWLSSEPTSTSFTVMPSGGTIGNANGVTYVAYLFAHDAGGFGAAGTDNVISCGSFTTASSSTDVTLGYEPQFVLLKRTNSTSNWFMLDTMRGMDVNAAINDPVLYANTGGAEDTTTGILGGPTATGFNVQLTSGQTWIYIAIRRGPMRTPTTGTSVFNPVVYTGTNVDNRLVDTNIAPDMVMVRQRNDTVLGGMVVGDRLRGQPYMLTGTTGAEVNDANSFDAQIVSGTEYGTAFSSMNGFWCGNDATSKLNASTVASNQVAEAFKRAPAFFDQVCYTGTGAAISLTHNLGVPPEMAIVKYRGFNTATNSRWNVGHKDLSTVKPSLILNTAASAGASLFWDPDWSSAATSTSLTLSSNQSLSAFNYVAYLFATCPGVSKVGSYTGNAAQTAINCGFTSSARFVLIKRYDADGDWYVWDSARGIIDSNDPYLRPNSTGAEVTTTDFVDTTTTGFEITAAASATVNINAANYIYLAIS